jgi:hypothetical protein
MTEAALASALERFAAEACAALRDRERDPIGAAERAAIYSRDLPGMDPIAGASLRDGLLEGYRKHKGGARP